MTVVGLQREEPRVVDADFVADVDAIDDGGIGRDVDRVTDRFEHQADCPRPSEATRPSERPDPWPLRW